MGYFDRLAEGKTTLKDLGMGSLYNPALHVAEEAPPDPRIVTGVSSGGGSSSQPVMPPVIELLQEMRARRAQQATVASNIAAALLQAAPMAAPAGTDIFPGMEQGGLADTLMGIITGRGGGASAVLDKLRAPGKTTIPISGMNVPEPSVGAELPGALSAAMQILSGLRNVPTGSQGQSSTQWSLPQEGGLDIASVLALLSGLLQAGAGAAAPATPSVIPAPTWGFNPTTGDVSGGG